MKTAELQKDFEATLTEDCVASGTETPDLRTSPCVLDDGAVIYINDITQACWWAYRKGWLASRKAIVVTLPEIDPFETEANLHIDDCADRIKAAGLTVAYDKENDNG